jgi:hypothetical protein
VTAADGRHLLLNDPDGPHQLWLVNTTSAPGVGFVLPNDDNFAIRLQAVERFRRRLAARPSGPLPRSLLLTRSQRARLTLQLRSLDGLEEGVSRREITAILLDPEVRGIPAIEWKNAALRKRINRIIARAKLMRSGGYLTLLRGDAERAMRFRKSK